MMAERAQPEFKLAQVAAVLSPFQVVINKGAVDGVRMGQEFLFYTLGDEIIDPASGQELGKLEVLRGRGRVIHVQERISIVQSTARKNYYEPQGALGLGLGLARMPVSYDELPFTGIQVGDSGRPI